MKTLLILRHAKSSWNFPELRDHDRPLNKRGRHDAPRMGRLLLEKDLIPDLIISSTAERALSTAEAAALECGYEGKITQKSALYHGEVSDYVDAARQALTENEIVMLVGHNPGIEEFVAKLGGQSRRMPTGALAWVQLAIDDWSQFSLASQSDLRQIWRPKEAD